MNYEEIGKEAVKHGYDGGGIWKDGCHFYWRSYLENPPPPKYWPDFSYPETEGAALAWILEKYNEINGGKFENVYITGPLDGFYELRLKANHKIENLSRKTQKIKAILTAIESLGLRKKDNSPMGLNKRLLEVGFRKGECRWGKAESWLIANLENISDSDIENGWIPDGSHPSTIGVATAWLRSFPKIGEDLSFSRNGDKKWGTLYIKFERANPDGFDSELEALVEFAEWAKEEGLMS